MTLTLDEKTTAEPRSSEPRPRSRSWRRRVLFVAAALVSCLVVFALLGELYVRLRHPQYADLWGAIRSNPTWVRELRPNASGRIRSLTRRLDGAFEYDASFHTNEQGLREKGPIGAKTKGRSRVLCLGDSLTFGMGVEDDQVWERGLEPAFEPVNAGWASGYAPDTACLFLEARGIGLEPDVVLECLTVDNDLADMGQKSRWTTDASGRLVSIEHEWGGVPDWIQALALPRFLALQVYPSVRFGAARVERQVPEELAAAEKRGLERLDYALRRERDFLAQQKIPLVVLLCPTHRFEPDASEGERAWAACRRDLMRGVAQKLGLAVLDPEGSPELSAAPGPHFFHEGHMTASGNLGLGRFVARALREWTESTREK